MLETPDGGITVPKPVDGNPHQGIFVRSICCRNYDILYCQFIIFFKKYLLT